jgi:hypothetical protein
VILPFSDALVVTNKFDAESARLADRHYSRRTVNDRQFMPPGRTCIIRDTQGLMVFGWNWQYDWKRFDRQRGYYCSIFHNESERRSSDVILECELVAIAKWGKNRMYTFIDPAKVQSVNPGYCFKCAGWRFEGLTASGKHILAKGAYPL